MNTKQVRKQLKYRNPIEAIRESSSDVVKTTKTVLKQEVQEDINRAWNQILGVSQETNRQIEQVDSAKEEILFEAKQSRVEAAPAIDYIGEILHSETRISNENNRQLNMKIEQLRIEIARLAKSSKQLEVTVKDASIQSIGPNVGKYHLNFFEWVLATVQAARIRVEESANWLTQVSGKAQKRGYWASVKSHGTSYMLSGERVVAQQTG